MIICLLENLEFSALLPDNWVEKLQLKTDKSLLNGLIPTKEKELLDAVKNGNIHHVKFCIQSGFDWVDLNATDSDFDCSLLHWATRPWIVLPSMVKLLRDNGARNFQIYERCYERMIKEKMFDTRCDL